MHVDVLVIGAGAAGLSAALAAARAGARVCVLSKTHPLRAPTVAALGGISAALGHEEEDHPLWHFYDTVRGGDWLGDMNAQRILAEEAPAAVLELAALGLPFNRRDDGRIAQRPFGGHTRDFGAAPVKRACYAADRTGHALLSTLYGACLAQGIAFRSDFLALSLLQSASGRFVGILGLDLPSGNVEAVTAGAVVLALGGGCRNYQETSNNLGSTGDGFALALGAGLPLQDMEFVQFHPTGLIGTGILITEAARGEGGYLTNRLGQRFMDQVAPRVKDLAPRDVVSQAIYKELHEGRGICGDAGPGDHVLLHLEHLPAEILEERLPEVLELAHSLLHLDARRVPIPVSITAHYLMGGIPTTVDGAVVRDEQSRIAEGLFAAGECASVSVHGANRLGTNSLLDLIVFGRRAGRAAAGSTKNETPVDSILDCVNQRLSGFWQQSPGESAAVLRAELTQTMSRLVGVERSTAGLTQAQNIFENLWIRGQNLRVADTSGPWNQALQDAIEVQHMLEYSLVQVAAALARTESRGAHLRVDETGRPLPRDDAKWRVHSLGWRSAQAGVKLATRPVDTACDDPRLVPSQRKY